MVDDSMRDVAPEDAEWRSNPARGSDQIAACYERLLADQRIELHQPRSTAPCR